MNGVMLLIIAVNMIFVAVGAYKPVFRCIGAWYSCLICPANFTIIIASFFIRLSPAGQVCALSIKATNWPSVNLEDTNGNWTYARDAMLILGILII